MMIMPNKITMFGDSCNLNTVSFQMSFQSLVKTHFRPYAPYFQWSKL